MPIIFLIFGILLISAGVHGNGGKFFSDLSVNFIPGTGGIQKTYLGWAIAIFIIAATGYYQKIRPITIAFLVLIFAVMLLENNSKTLSAIENLTQGQA